MCLITYSSLCVLSCGHFVCTDDCAKLGLSTEQPWPSSRIRKAVSAFARHLPINLIQHVFLVLLLVNLSWDPGRPMQLLHTALRAVDDAVLAQFRLASWRHDRLCSTTCYETHENSQHTCDNDCGCDGERTCSYFGFCVGESATCYSSASSASTSWILESSSPSAGPAKEAAAATGHSSEVGRGWVYWPGTTHFQTVGHGYNSTSVSAWSDAIALHTVGGLSLQLRVADGTGGTPPEAQVRLRGPVGHSIRIQLEYQRVQRSSTSEFSDDWIDRYESHLEPWPLGEVTSKGDGGWLVGGVNFPADEPLLRCVRSRRISAVGDLPNETEPCDGLRLVLTPIEIGYTPTFYSWQRPTASTLLRPYTTRFAEAFSPWADTRTLADRARDRLWSAADMSRGSSLAATFMVAGTGRFLVRVFPAGDRDAPTGRCSVLVTGPPGAEFRYLLRVRSLLFGTLQQPLICHDAVHGCWVKDAGPAASAEHHHELTMGGGIAISLLFAAVPTWHNVDGSVATESARWSQGSV